LTPFVLLLLRPLIADDDDDDVNNGEIPSTTVLLVGRVTRRSGVPAPEPGRALLLPGPGERLMGVDGCGCEDNGVLLSVDEEEEEEEDEEDKDDNDEEEGGGDRL
jgi:hypothetical protein